MHNILLRQLKRYQLNESACPQQIEQWQQFLGRINRTYVEMDQDRYLSERSQEISSREMQALYTELEEAQHIAHIGSWSYNYGTDEMRLSSEAYNLFGLDLSSSPNYQQILQLIYPDDKKQLDEFMQAAMQQGKNFEIEVRLKKADQICWINILSKTVYDETNEKIQKIKGTVMDITQHKEALEREAQLNKQLVSTARRAGMAEVATSVLHNVGNVLNSVNVTAMLLTERLRASKMSNLKKITKIFQDQADKLGEYIENDPKGQHIPGYLIKLADYWEEEQAEFLDELVQLEHNIQHIKNIVAMQQSISKTAGLIEKLSVKDALEEALLLYADDLKKAKIEIIRDYQEQNPIVLDKIKLNQILVNLIHNAKDALFASNNKDKKLTLRIIDNKDSVLVQIIDNGIGIPLPDLKKIYSYGFTTKKDGHGFGLHTSAISAHEMNGSLIGNSEGINKGAIFTLELPKNQIE